MTIKMYYDIISDLSLSLVIKYVLKADTMPLRVCKIFTVYTYFHESKF